jgi:hypothetical protein
MAVNAWIQERRNEAGKDFIQVEVQYWYLNEVSCVIIPRNRAWFQAALPRFQDIWATIERERVSGYDHRLPKKRATTTTTQPALVVRKLGSETNVLDGLLASLVAGELEEEEQNQIKTA